MAAPRALSLGSWDCLETGCRADLRCRGPAVPPPASPADTRFRSEVGLDAGWPAVPPGRWVTASVPVGGRCSPWLPARSGTVVARGLLIRSSLAGSVSDGHSGRFTAPKGRYRSGRLLGCGTSLLYTCPGRRLRVRAGGTAEWSPRADTEAGTTSGDHEVSSP